MIETVLPTGTKVYKGFPPGIGVIRRTDNFFVTTNARVASAYGHVATYTTNRPLRLFVLNHENIVRVLNTKGLSASTKIMLRFALGTRTTRARQLKAYRKVLGGRERFPQRIARNIRPGQRLSVDVLDRQTFEKFSREFLIPRKYDGFYSASKPSVFHGGRFHSEVMICKPMTTLDRVFSKRLSAPVRSVFGVRDIVKALPSLFVEYSKGHTRLTRPYGGFVLYLGGGMAVKLYMEARALKAPPKVLQTTDFDFTFSATQKLTSQIGVRLRVRAMRHIMYAHILGFVRWLGSHYGVRPQILMNDFVPPGRFFPTTKKRVYHVISYALQFPGVPKPVDFVDTTLAFVPGLRRENIHYEYSKHFGMPIERLKFLSKDVLAVLASSFATKDPTLKSRNPLVGKRAEKGLKNTARLASLIKVKGAHPSAAVRSFVNTIQKGQTQKAFRHARQIIRQIQGHKKIL